MVEMTFNCENCNKQLLASFSDEDVQDKVYCTCGKVWVVIKPIETISEE